MTTLLLLVLFALTSSALANCSVERAQTSLPYSTYRFAVQLTARIARENDNHFVASPFSVWALLATASLGAAGQTLDEFRNVLGLPRDQCFVDRYLELVRSMTDGNVTVEKSSSIYAADRLRIKEEFVRRARDAGTGEVVVMSFDDPEAVAANISQFVSHATHGKITDLVSAADVRSTSLVLIDALYFKGLWQIPFPYEATQRRPFYNDWGFRVGEVQMMQMEGIFNVSSVRELDASVLKLPFGADGRFAMLVFLPERGATLTDVINSLWRESRTTIVTGLEWDFERYMTVELPRFELTSQLDNLHEVLGDMGLRAAFHRATAEFPFISDLPVSFSKVVQKATVTVSETGAEGSAVTYAADRISGGGPSFSANRPFLYMIVDTVTHVPLFTGAYSRPS